MLIWYDKISKTATTSAEGACQKPRFLRGNVVFLLVLLFLFFLPWFTAFLFVFFRSDREIEPPRRVKMVIDDWSAKTGRKNITNFNESEGDENLTLSDWQHNAKHFRRMEGGKNKKMRENVRLVRLMFAQPASPAQPTWLWWETELHRVATPAWHCGKKGTGIKRFFRVWWVRLVEGRERGEGWVVIKTPAGEKHWSFPRKNGDAATQGPRALWSVLCWVARRLLMPSFSWMIFFRHRYIWSLRIPVLCGGRTWLNYCPAAIVHIKRLKSRTLKTSVVSSIATTHITILRASTRYHCRSLSLT